MGGAARRRRADTHWNFHKSGQLAGIFIWYNCLCRALCRRHYLIPLCSTSTTATSTLALSLHRRHILILGHVFVNHGQPHSHSSFHRWHVSEKYVPVLVTTDSLTERPPPPPWQRPKWQIDQIFSSVTQKIFSLLDLDTVRVSSFKSQNVNWKFENSFLNLNSTSKLQLYWEKNSQLGQLQVWF